MWRLDSTASRIGYLCTMLTLFGVPALGLLQMIVATVKAQTGPDAVANPGNQSSNPFTVWGCVGGVQSYSMRGGICNIGDETLPGDIDDEHPMWTSNFYRLSSNRFEQIGQSWIKHDDWKTDLENCTLCDSYATCDQGETNDPYGLDPGCSDIYTCNNGCQDVPLLGFWLGPRSQINPWSGAYPPSGESAIHCDPGGGVLACRLQIAKGDLTGSYSSAEFFLEQQVIMPGESTAVRSNNVSYRTATVGSCSGNCDTNTVCNNYCNDTRSCSGDCSCVHPITPTGGPFCTEAAIHA